MSGSSIQHVGIWNKFCDSKGHAPRSAAEIARFCRQQTVKQISYTAATSLYNKCKGKTKIANINGYDSHSNSSGDTYSNPDYDEEKKYAPQEMKQKMNVRHTHTRMDTDDFAAHLLEKKQTLDFIKTAPLQGDEPKSADVVGGSLVSFTAGISDDLQQDVLDSTLFCQLHANQLYDRDTDTQKWYKHFGESLNKIGWINSGFSIQEYSGAGKLATIHEDVIKILTASVGSVLSGNAFLVIKQTLNALKSLSDQDKRVVLFNSKASTNKGGCFQISCAQETNTNTIELEMAVFYFESTRKLRRILWSSYATGEMKFFYGVQKFIFNKHNYKREAIQKALKDKTEKFILSVELSDHDDDDDDLLFSQSINAGDTITRQCISQFTNQIFQIQSEDLDPKKYKILFPGKPGPSPVDYNNPNVGADSLRLSCNIQPSVDSLMYRPTASTLPDGYAIAVSALKIPLVGDNPEYEATWTAYQTKLSQQAAAINQAKTDFREYIQHQREDDLPADEYKNWQEWLEFDNDAEYEKYLGIKQQTATAKQDLANVQLTLGDNDPAIKAIKAFNTWYDKTESGTTGPDSYWTTSPNISDAIDEWEEGTNLNGGTFTVDNSSYVYQKTTASAGFKGFWDDITFGASGSGESVFSSSSKYRFDFNWKASATFNVSPPSVYNLDLIKQYSDNNNIAAGYKGNLPLTGTPDSPIQDVVTSVVLMYGFGMTATFDAATYKSITEQAEGGISFGWFGIGGKQSYTKTSYDHDSCTITVTPAEVGGAPFVIGYTVDSLSN